MNLTTVTVLNKSNKSKNGCAIKKLRNRIYKEHPIYNPFRRTRRRLFAITSLYNLAFEKIITSGNSQLYVQAVKSAPKVLYHQLLRYFIGSHSQQTVSKDLWLAVAAKNKINIYDLDDIVFTWDWLNLTLEQCFLFRCYDWLDAVPSFVYKTLIKINTPYYVQMNSEFVGETSSVCHSCIRHGFRNIEIMETIKSRRWDGVLINNSVISALPHGRWYDFFNEIQSWCCICNIQPLFALALDVDNFQ